jgi:hypothetical protein
MDKTLIEEDLPAAAVRYNARAGMTIHFAVFDASTYKVPVDLRRATNPMIILRHASPELEKTEYVPGWVDQQYQVVAELPYMAAGKWSAQASMMLNGLPHTTDHVDLYIEDGS